MSKCGEKKRNQPWKLILWLFHPASMPVSFTWTQQPGFLLVYFRYVGWPSIHVQINLVNVALEHICLVYEESLLLKVYMLQKQ